MAPSAAIAPPCRSSAFILPPSAFWGGWAALLRSGPHVRRLSGGAIHATSQLMELQAIEEALGAIKRPGAEVLLRTDSECAVRWLTRLPDGQTIYRRREQPIVAACARIDAIIAEKRLRVTFTQRKDEG